MRLGVRARRRGSGAADRRGRVEGLIIEAPRGAGGFGYDPYFWLAGAWADRGATRSCRQESAQPSRHCHARAARPVDGAEAGAGQNGPGAAMNPPPLALYVHMPWCVRKCPYCDFNSHQLKSAAPDGGYIDALIGDFDAELPRARDRRIDTVFFGGGTPSLFQPEEFAGCSGALRQRAPFADDVEITLEANPGTIERGRFAGYREAGINRVSLGAQTFGRRALERLGRIHSADDTHRAVAELARGEAGQFQSRFDVRAAASRRSRRRSRMCESPARSGPRISPITSLRSNLARCFTRGRRRCPMRMRLGRCKPSDRDCSPRRVMCNTKCRRMRVLGKRCRHNLNYWRFGDYLGIGAGAHGKLSLALPQAHFAHDQAQAAPRISGADAHAGRRRRAGGPHRRAARSLRRQTCRSNSC